MLIKEWEFSSVAQSCLTLCDSINHSMPGLPVHHQLPEFTQTHVHRVGDAIQPSHPLSSPSPPAPNPSQHQGPFQWVNSSHEVAKVFIHTHTQNYKRKQDVKVKFPFISSHHLNTCSAPLGLVHSPDPISSPIHTLLLGWVSGTVYWCANNPAIQYDSVSPRHV